MATTVHNLHIHREKAAQRIGLTCYKNQFANAEEQDIFVIQEARHLGATTDS